MSMETDYSILNTRIEDLELSRRAKNTLALHNIMYLGHLVQFAEIELSGLRNLGAWTMTNIKDMLESIGLSLGTKTDWIQPCLDDSESYLYERLMDPENMMACRRLLASGWSFIKLSRQFFSCTPQVLRAYLKDTSNLYSQVLDRMIEDGLFLAKQPLGQYMCYLMDRLDMLVALELNADTSKQEDIDYSIALHSQLLQSAINANKSVIINKSKTWYRVESDTILKHNLLHSLHGSYKKNIRYSWIELQISALPSLDLYPQYNHRVSRHYNTDLSLESVFSGYEYNAKAIARLSVINGQILHESDLKYQEKAY